MYQVIADKQKALDFFRSVRPITVTQHFTGLCQVKDGEVIACVIYDEFNGRNCMTHIAAKSGVNWMTRWFLHEMFKYPFITLGATRITGPILSDNDACLRFVNHLGFRREAVLEKAGPSGQDICLHVMFREDCRYA